MVRIYIRHAEKEYEKGEGFSFKHDPPITQDGVVQSRKMARLLVEKFGPPCIIVCSPYRRTRETACVMASVLKEPVKIKCDINLSEYLGNHKDEAPDITPETKVFKLPPHPERWYQFKQRLQHHNDMVKDFDSSSMVVWFICHGVVISQMTKLFTNTHIRSVAPLGCVEFLKTDRGIEAKLISFSSNEENSVSTCLDNQTKQTKQRKQKDCLSRKTEQEKPKSSYKMSSENFLLSISSSS